MSTGVCELCGRESTTWVGDTEVCERCAASFREEAERYLMDAAIDLAIDWAVPVDDAYEAMTDGTFCDDKLVKKIAEEEEDLIMDRLLSGSLSVSEAARIINKSSPRAIFRIETLRRKGHDMKYVNGAFVLAEGRDGKANTDD